jgi:hypothetical protein
MKSSLFLFCLNFVSFIFSQTLAPENTDSLRPAVQFENTTSTRKPVKVNQNSSLEFIQFVPVCSSEDSTIMCETRITGLVSDLNDDSVHIDAEIFLTRKFNHFDLLYSERKNTTGSSYKYSLNLSEIDGVYYSSHLRSKLRNASTTLMGLSLFAALVAAPLFSLEYKSYGVGTPGGFNRKQYFAIAGTGMAVAAASFSFYILMKPKYYSFAADDFNPKKQRWMLRLEK